jgi:hypothetical protein
MHRFTRPVEYGQLEPAEVRMKARCPYDAPNGAIRQPELSGLIVGLPNGLVRPFFGGIDTVPGDERVDAVADLAVSSIRVIEVLFKVLTEPQTAIVPNTFEAAVELHTLEGETA